MGIHRKVAWAIAAALALAALLAVLAWRLSWMVPSWWNPPDPASPAVVELADRVEYRLIEEAQRIRPDPQGCWRLRIRQDQINAWLAVRLPDWVAHHADLSWPKEFGLPQVQLARDGLRIALPVRDESRHRMIVARLVPRLRDDRLRLSIETLAVGRLLVPGDPISAIRRMARRGPGSPSNDPLIKPLLRILQGDEAIDATFDLADGRRVRLLDVDLAQAEMVLTLQTLPSAAAEDVRGAISPSNQNEERD
jgi:hypothetical protein